MDWIRLLWAATLINGSGLVSLALSLHSNVKRIAFLTGMMVERVFGVLIFITHGKIKALIPKLEAMPCLLRRSLLLASSSLLQSLVLPRGSW